MSEIDPDIPLEHAGTSAFIVIRVDDTVHSLFKVDNKLSKEELGQVALHEVQQVQRILFQNEVQHSEVITIIQGLSFEACVKLGVRIGFLQIEATRSAVLQLLNPVGTN